MVIDMKNIVRPLCPTANFLETKRVSFLTTLVFFNNTHCVSFSKAYVIVVLLLVILYSDVLFQQNWLTNRICCETNKQTNKQTNKTRTVYKWYLFCIGGWVIYGCSMKFISWVPELSLGCFRGVLTLL